MNGNEENFIQKKYKELKETDLIELAQHDDYKALEELIKRVQTTVYVTLSYLNDKKSDCNDLTQDVLIKMAQNIKKLKQPKAFKSWLNQIVVHSFYDDLRRKNKKYITVSIDEDLSNINSHIHNPIDIADEHSNLDDFLIFNELDMKIKQSILNLPILFRLPIILREYQGMSYEEIAHSLNTNVGTVKSRIARARNRLQEELKAYIA